MSKTVQQHFGSGDIDDKKSLYIKSLLWASKKGSAGFDLDELKEAVVETQEDWAWVQRMLLGEINDDPPLIWRMSGTGKYCLTGSGAAAVLDYTELKEARQSGKRAMWVAIISIIIGVLVGAGQIWVGWKQYTFSKESVSNSQLNIQP